MRNKKIFLFSLLTIILCVTCTGCVGDITRGIRHAGFAPSSANFKCKYLLPEDEDNSLYRRLFFLSGNMAITDTGKVYELSFDRTFSNNENCRPASFSKEIVAIMDGSIGKTKDGHFYQLKGGGIYTGVPSDSKNYSLYKILLGSPSVKKAFTVDSENGIYYVLKKDGNVYRMVVRKENYKSPYELVVSETKYSSVRYGTIIDFNYDPNDAGTFIRSTDKLYRMYKTNSEECTKYADKPCLYVMNEDTELPKYYDYILGFNGSMLITSYGKIFSAT